MWCVLQGWKATMCSPRPASGRQGMLLPVEDDKWQLILTGLQGDHPPTDEEGYLEFARSLPSPEIYDALTQAEPLGPIHVFNRTENVKRFYGQVGPALSLSSGAPSFTGLPWWTRDRLGRSCETYMQYMHAEPLRPIQNLTQTRTAEQTFGQIGLDFGQDAWQIIIVRWVERSVLYVLFCE